MVVAYSGERAVLLQVLAGECCEGLERGFQRVGPLLEGFDLGDELFIESAVPGLVCHVACCVCLSGALGSPMLCVHLVWCVSGN